MIGFRAWLLGAVVRFCCLFREARLIVTFDVSTGRVPRSGETHRNGTQASAFIGHLTIDSQKMLRAFHDVPLFFFSSMSFENLKGENNYWKKLIIIIIVSSININFSLCQ